MERRIKASDQHKRRFAQDFLAFLLKEAASRAWAGQGLVFTPTPGFVFTLHGYAPFPAVPRIAERISSSAQYPPDVPARW